MNSSAKSATGAPLQMIVTERAPPLVPCLLAHADRHLTMKQSDAGTVIIGGAWTAETAPAGQARTRLDSLDGSLPERLARFTLARFDTAAAAPTTPSAAPAATSPRA